MNSVTESFTNLVDILNELREKCPWDKKQTIHTLRSMTIEEVYELTEAITEENWNEIKEELGDILLHIVFYSKIAMEKNKFTLTDVIESISKKLITRHPHIYGDVKVNDDEDVKRNWQKIKLQKGNQSVLSGVPKRLPALIKALSIQEKAKQTGFEWKNKEDVWKKVQEEMDELQEAVNKNNADNIESELGDVLFSLVNYARFLHVDAETALEKTNRKFIHRFTKMEQVILQKQKDITRLSLEEMDDIWNEIKKTSELDTGT